MNKKLLTRPFETGQIKRRKGQHGKTLSYVDIAAVIARLNEAADSWSFDIVEHQIQAGEVIVLGRLTLDCITKMAFGGSSITVDRSGEVVSVADDLKAASSDALKKAASLFGVGLELYGGVAKAHDPARQPTPARAPEDREAPSRRPVGDRVTARQLSAMSVRRLQVDAPRTSVGTHGRGQCHVCPVGARF